MMYMEMLVFVSSFASVCAMGVNSKIIRDNHIALGAIVSWVITVANFALMWAVLHAELSPLMYILVSGAGGSIGIIVAQYGYAKYGPPPRGGL